MIDLPQAMLLGLIQGLTEFIPISSTAHLRLVPALISPYYSMPDPGAAYSAVIQLGTLMSLVVYFRKDLAGFIQATLSGIFSGRPFSDPRARMAWYLVIGTVPVSVAGLLLSDFIEGPFRSLYVIASSLIGLAIILWLADVFSKKDRAIEELNWKDALLIGVGQAFALVPGASRSGTTLTAGLMLGFDRYAAMRFSFLLSIPAIALSGVYELIKEYSQLEGAGLGGLAAGTLVAALVGYGTVAGLLQFLRSHTTLAFVLYRISMGILLLALLYAGLLEP